MVNAPTEQELCMATPGLLAQPALWPQLRLPRVTAASAAHAPWACYWATRTDPTLGIAPSRVLLEAALATFEQQGERTGALLCLAAIIESFYVDEAVLDPLDAWIARLGGLLPASDGPPAWASEELEARVLACGVGILLRNPSHPLLAHWAERGATLVRQLKPGAGRLKLATFLAQYHLWRGEFGRASLIVEALPGLDMRGLLPGEALVWLETLATYARYAAQPERGRQAIDSALQLVRKHGLSEHEYALHAHGAALALAARDESAAQTHLNAMRPVLDREPQADQTHYWHFHAGLALLRGDAARAVELARAALSNSQEIGGPYRTATHALSLGQALLETGEPLAALAHFELALAAAQAIDAGLLLFTARLMRASAFIDLGREADALAELGPAMVEGARRGFRTTAVWWLPVRMAELARMALAHDIEPAYLRRFIRQHGLPGPDAAFEAWPWPLVLRGFGEFEALLDDVCLSRSTGKTAQRPLDLLRALLAHGDSPLPVGTILDWLWPDGEPDAQRKAFDVALLRLRRMLGAAHLVRLEGGRLSLDPRWVWSDVSALHALMQRIGSARSAPPQALREWARQLLGLVRGPFLAGEEAFWIEAARQRYRQRFVITVSQLAAQLEPVDAGASAQLYERALDLEPLAESLSRQLMRLQARRGEHAEALRAWRGCCAMLAVAAGIGPSAETRRLAAELGLPAARHES
jgi:LuxR family transcriptional regulator, maltose regulon positive regulatory protein